MIGSERPVEEGSIGAGTGTVAFGFKGGIGTSSRLLPAALGGYTVGVLVQSNFGGILTIAGAPVGRELGSYYLKNYVEGDHQANGSIMIIVATDAPLDHRDTKRRHFAQLFDNRVAGRFGHSDTLSGSVRPVGGPVPHTL